MVQYLHNFISTTSNLPFVKGEPDDLRLFTGGSSFDVVWSDMDSVLSDLLPGSTAGSENMPATKNQFENNQPRNMNSAFHCHANYNALQKLLVVQYWPWLKICENRCRYVRYILHWPLPAGAFQGQWKKQLKWIAYLVYISITVNHWPSTRGIEAWMLVMSNLSLSSGKWKAEGQN